MKGATHISDKKTTKEFEDVETCPLPGRDHKRHDDVIREMTKRLASAGNPGLGEVENLRVKVAELEAALTKSSDRTTRILAERLVVVERYNERLKKFMREKMVKK